MPSIWNIHTERNHNLAVSVARQKAVEIAERMSGLVGKLDYKWSKDRLDFAVTSGDATGVKGFLDITPSTITVHIDLTLRAAFKKVQIASYVDQYLTDAGI